ncbi:MAG TPA: hypothetical protein VL134_04195 [Leptolyngbya sp.]|nr:hypothetical protein [Leptolyngbya sp.]
MKNLKAVWASGLMGLGIFFVAAGLYAPFNSSISQQKQRDEFAACLILGLPLAGWGGWIHWGLRRDRQQKSLEALKAAFHKLVTQNNGRVTILAFSLETGLTGTAAKAYLDQCAQEFQGNFDVDEEGNITYRFHLGSKPEPS